MALPVNLNEAEDAEIASSEFWTLRGVEYEY